MPSNSALTVSPALPHLVSVAPAQAHRLADGRLIEPGSHDLLVRATSLQRLLAGTA